MEYKEKYPVHKAAREGRLEDLKRLLTAGDYCIDVGTSRGVRPLHEACLAGRSDSVALLIDYGADVNVTNSDGTTPLCDACCTGSVECIKLLLDHGAFVNPATALDSPLHEAIIADNWECIHLLLNAGANVNETNYNLDTPLYTAARTGHIKSAAVLLQAGVSPQGYSINRIPLHEATRRKDVELLKLLIDHGGNVYERNSQGFTARQGVSSDDTINAMLQEWEQTPMSLLHYCRLKIRTAVGPGRMKLLSSLHLPQSLLSFVKFE